ncbi:MAG: lipopolysaccharide assembly LapA domain-containing protein [Nitrospinales bacterium]
MSALKFIISICLFILFVSLAAENIEPVPVSYYDLHLNVNTIRLPLLAVIVASLFAGFFLAWAGGLFKTVKLKSRIKKQNKIIDKMNSELEKRKSGKS